MNIDAETNQKIQNLQGLEHNFQALMMQKQTFQVEFNELETALAEVEKTKDDVFKVLGQVMIKADKNSLKTELKEKKDLLEIRLKSIEKQELSMREEVERLRGEIVEKLQ
ncbi:MAG: prefoldin subunit beta [Candidatus Pacearchaeota archaeon]|jgi:prefoldin beta subunit